MLPALGVPTSYAIGFSVARDSALGRPAGGCPDRARLPHIAAAVYPDWLLPDSDRDVPPTRLTEEMVTMLPHGITHRPSQ